MESPMGSYGSDLGHPGTGAAASTHHYVPTNAILKRPSSTQSDDAKRIKTYQCEACDKWFTSSGHLKRHFNTTLHKNATRHQHKSGSPRIGTPASMMGDLSDSQQGPGSNSISNLNTTTSTLNMYHHTSDMSNYAPHSEAGSVKDELDQLSVATEDLDEGLSGTGTPATPTDSLEGPPTPVRVSGNGSSTVSNPQAGPTGEYRCSECNKVFNRLCYLKQHNKSFHNGEKPFKCGQCGKRFPVEVLYQEHLAKHAGDKPYKCEVCPKQFNHKTDLRRHMCLHTGEKPFACEVCGKGFIREDRMVKHSDTHKKKQPILMT
eukprot:04608.XXX_216301_213221_1 [CDS] Oithona nana genome sequencing.